MPAIVIAGEIVRFLGLNLRISCGFTVADEQPPVNRVADHCALLGELRTCLVSLPCLPYGSRSIGSDREEKEKGPVV